MSFCKNIYAHENRVLPNSALQGYLVIYGIWTQRRQWHPTPVFSPGESQGQGSLVGCRLRGHTESDTTEVTQQQQQQQYMDFITYLNSETHLNVWVRHLGPV